MKKCARGKMQFAALLATGVLYLLVASSLSADTHSPFRAHVIQAAEFDSAIEGSLAESSQVTVINGIEPVTITARVATLGNVTFHFNREWHVPSVSYADNGFALQPLKRDGMHLQGVAIYRASKQTGKRQKVRTPVAATLYYLEKKEPWFEATFRADAMGKRSHYFQVKAGLPDRFTPQSLRVRRVSRHAFSGKTCGVTTGAEAAMVEKLSLTTAEMPKKMAGGTLQSFDIATDTDYEWYARYGSSSNTKIQSILNKVQTIYQDQLDLTFSLTKQVVLTTSGSRYTSSNVDTLLESFRTYSESHQQLGSADLYHLYTGKDTYLDDNGSQNSSVIGLAYLGVTCAFPDYSYGLTEDLDDALNHITTAHEVGHNFSAQHDTAGSIMGTVLNLSNPPTQFSTNSKAQIGSHVSANSSCLSDGSAVPTPTPTPVNGCGVSPGNDSGSDVLLLPKLTSKGILCLSVELTSADSSCSVEIRSATNSGKVFTGTVLTTFAANATSTSFKDVAIKRSAVKATKPQKVYVGAVRSCGGTLTYSPVKTLKPYNIKSSKTALKTTAWMRLMAKLVAATSPQNP